MSATPGRSGYLQDAAARRGWLFRFLMYYGPELTSIVLTRWCAQRGIRVLYIQPGQPQQNAYIERFNRTYRDEVLNAYVFTSLAEVRQLTATFLTTYNTKRPHDSLGRVPPRTFLPRPTAPEESHYEWSA